MKARKQWKCNLEPFAPIIFLLFAFGLLGLGFFLDRNRPQHTFTVVAHQQKNGVLGQRYYIVVKDDQTGRMANYRCSSSALWYSYKEGSSYKNRFSSNGI